MSDEDRLRRLMGAELLDRAHWSPTNYFIGVQDRARREQVPFDGAAALAYWGDLIRLGVVDILGSGQVVNIGEMQLSERGRRYLALGERSPHDPARYLESLRGRGEAAEDSVVREYAAEAARAFAAGTYRASLVMLGCACEQLLYLMADAVVSAPGFAAGHREKVRKLRDSVRSQAAELHDAIRKALEQPPAPLPVSSNELDRRLTAVFEHARSQRNRYGHPTADPVSEDDAHAGLLLLPGLCDFVSKLLPAVRGVPPVGGS